MRIIVFLFIGLFIIHNKSNFGDAKALSGISVRPAVAHEFTFLACIVQHNSNDIVIERDLLCTAALVSPNTILSAEHCLNGIENIGFRVIIGSVDVSVGTAFFPAWFISFDQWSARSDLLIKYHMNDVAIIKLTEFVSHEIVPAALSTLKVQELFGLEAVLVGWGVLRDNSVPAIAHTGTARVLSKSECEQKLSRILTYNVYIEKVLICTIGEPYIGLNSGDSGGPLLYNNEIIGINKGICPQYLLYNDPNQINVHFHIRHYRTFITYHKNI